MKNQSALRKLGKTFAFLRKKARVASKKKNDDQTEISSGTDVAERSDDDLDSVNIREKSTKQPAQPCPLPDPSYFSSIHVLVNRSRAQRGLPLLFRSRALDQLASEKAQQVAREDSAERAPRLELIIKLQANTVEENVLCGPSIRAMHISTMRRKSSRIRQNILSQNINEMGMATALASDGNLYMVQYFRFNPDLANDSRQVRSSTKDIILVPPALTAQHMASLER